MFGFSHSWVSVEVPQKKKMDPPLYSPVDSTLLYNLNTVYLKADIFMKIKLKYIQKPQKCRNGNAPYSYTLERFHSYCGSTDYDDTS